MADQHFDVFLCHNSEDKPLIQQICHKLEERGIQTWLDEKQIHFGDSFLDKIQEALNSANAAAIFVGKKYPGQWQSLEANALISLFVSKSVRIIPVLLPGVEKIPDREIILHQFHHVRFVKTVDDEHVFDRLEEIITGKKSSKTEASTVNFEGDTQKSTATSIQKYDSSKILFIKNVKDPSWRWAYRLEGVKHDREPVFELMWRSGAHGVSLPKAGDLMILHQQAKVTHVIEFLDDEVRKTDFGCLRWVKVAWMPRQQDWYKLPHQEKVLGFSPRYADGTTHALQSRNFKAFKDAWQEDLSGFQTHFIKRLQEIDESL